MNGKVFPGAKFGKLTVIEIAERSENTRKTKWLCLCECGNKTIATQKALVERTKKSCGCLLGKNTFVDLTGKKFNMLTIKERVESSTNHVLYRCVCDCGKEKIADAQRIKSGETWNCGCSNRAKILYGLGRTRLYYVWKNMISRCYCSTSNSYKNYGGRGITVCDEWKNDFLTFRDWAYSTGYDENAKRGECTLDRIDNNGNYEPSNCRWVDMKVQNNNKRNSKNNF